MGTVTIRGGGGAPDRSRKILSPHSLLTPPKSVIKSSLARRHLHGTCCRTCSADKIYYRWAEHAGSMLDVHARRDMGASHHPSLPCAANRPARQPDAQAEQPVCGLTTTATDPAPAKPTRVQPCEVLGCGAGAWCGRWARTMEGPPYIDLQVRDPILQS